MAGLSFLSKKSWHTSNLNNQERVWLAEQKAAAEEKKTLELQKQIQEEIEREEFRKLKANAQGDTAFVDRGIHWMYEGGGAAATADDGGNFTGGAENGTQQTAEDAKNEEYLMGKEYAPDGGAKQGDFAVAATMTGALEKASTVGASIGMGGLLGVRKPAPVAAATELRIQDDAQAQAVEVADDEEDEREWSRDFHLRHEDPMFAVSQRRQEQEKEGEKRRRLLERAGVATVARPTVPRDGAKQRGDDGDDAEDASKRRNNEKKEKKEEKERKERKKRKRDAKSHRARARGGEKSRGRRRPSSPSCSPSPPAGAYSSDDRSRTRYRSRGVEGRGDDGDIDGLGRGGKRGEGDDDDRRRHRGYPGDRGRRSRSRSRSRSPRGRMSRSRSNRDEKSRSRSRSRSRRGRVSNRRSRSRSRSKSRSNRQRRECRHDNRRYEDLRRPPYNECQQRRGAAQNRNRQESSGGNRGPHSSSFRNIAAQKKAAGYGLVEMSLRDRDGSANEREGSPSQRPQWQPQAQGTGCGSRPTLGPDQRLLRAKREDEARERRGRFEESRSREEHRSGRKSKEEQERAVREMEQNARERGR